MRNSRVPDWAKEFISWDTCEIAQDEAKRLVEDGEYTDRDKAFHAACGDQDLYDMEWEYVCDWLTDFMNEVSDGNIYWRAEGVNHGWMHRRGFKEFKAKNGRELLRACLPDTECTFYIYLSQDKDMIIINNSHHDVPTGGEMYYITVDKGDEDDNE